MKKEEYEIMFNIEDDYWWYIGLRKLVMSYIERVDKKGRKLKILDAGCGTGIMLESCKYHEAYGLDFSKKALKYCMTRNATNLLRGSINALPFKSNYFDIVTSLDVMCCINVDQDMIILDEFYRVMNTNGVLLLNLPAYDYLQSTHDKAVHIKHRYVLNEVQRKVEKAGFEIENITYRNTILFPMIVVKRLIDRKLYREQDEPVSDLKPLPGLINRLFANILLFENSLINSGIHFPFGLSIYCIARKTN